MILRQLRSFTTVAEEGSVAQAARKLRVAQPALSRQIHSLEAHVGASLLDRDRRGVTVTPAGAAVLRTARKLVKSIDETLRRARLAADGELGRLRLALGRSAVHNPRVGRALAAACARYPEIELVVSEMPTFAQPRALLERDIDIAIGNHGTAEDRSIDHVALYADPIDSAMFAAGHPLGGKRSVTVSQLRDEQLVLVDPRVARSTPELYEALRRVGFTWEAHDTLESVYAQVVSGRGWIPVPHCYRETPPDGMVVIPIRDYHVESVVALRWRRGDQSPLIANVTAAIVQAIIGESDARPVTPRPAAPTAPRPDALPSGLALRHLRSLVVLAEEQSLSRAATRLKLSHSGLSRQIRALEQAIGIAVVDRNPHGVTITAAGEVLRQGALTALSQVELLLNEASRAGRGMAGRCTIGAIPSEVARDALLGPLKYVGERFPTITVELREMLSPTQLPALRAGDIDVGISTAFPGVGDDPSIESVRLFEDPIECALLSVSHPLAARAWLRPSDLEREPLVLPSREVFPHLHDAVMQVLGRIGLTPLMHAGVDGPRAIWRMVADAGGWTIGTRSMRAKAPAGLVAIPVEGLHMPAGVQLTWRRDEDNQDVLTVLDAFRTMPGVESTADEGA